ncbi:MAG: FAD-binding oxidoreductase [Bdellovibrionales bacterium]|nr:FAD-binding oxidoreductase [Bdellovibrionales bacterium]
MTFLERLRSEFPADFSTTDPHELVEYGKDWTKTYAPDPLVVVFPRTTEEVARFLKLASETGQPVVPSGGRTGLAGGAVAAKKEAVLSLRRMTRMDPVDPVARTVRVQAGAITEGVHLHAKPHGLTWPVDFASKGSSQVGGNIATNAGGVNVIRYGLTRQWVLGLEVVLPTGEILELNGALEKNNTGTDLRQLFIGSEGTLGVITEATLKLAPIPREEDVFLFAVPDLAAVLELFRLARTAPITLQAFEFFTDKCLARVTKNLGARPPFSTPTSHYVLVEIERPADAAVTEKWLEEVLGSGFVTDGTMAQSPREAEEFWRLREGISESLASTGLPHKNDVALPIASLQGFCAELADFFGTHYVGWEICNFGHIGDGNLHINIMKPDAMPVPEFRAATKAVDRDLFALVKKHKGSISAEHGIGLLKKEFLSFTRTPAEIALFRAMKAVFDPKGILNPGKIWD